MGLDAQVVGDERRQGAMTQAHPVRELLWNRQGEAVTDDPTALPDWFEAELAQRREFWSALRDGGLLPPEAEAAAIRREAAGE